jgi:hypothetical protein
VLVQQVVCDVLVVTQQASSIIHMPGGIGEHGALLYKPALYVLHGAASKWLQGLKLSFALPALHESPMHYRRSPVQTCCRGMQ